MPDETTFDAAQVTTGTVFSVDAETRTIRGLAVPYGVVGVKGGQQFVFGKGSVVWGEPKRVKLYIAHDAAQAVGHAFELTETDAGVVAAFKVARGARGDEALQMAEDGVWDGLSIGPGEGVKFTARDGVLHASRFPLREISLTPQPVFDDARLTSVAMSQEGNTMPDDQTEAPTMPSTATISVTGPVIETEPETEESLTASITTAIAAGFAHLSNPQGGPSVVPAGNAVEVDEPSPYRFDGVRGAHDFSSDLIAFGRDADSEAGQRLMTFLGEQFGPRFDVDTADVTAVNPSRHRPDMYVDERQYATPVYDALYSGSITDGTPFIVPKFNSASGLVADHTQGTEPTPGTFTATTQTVTPSALSGKVEITREVWDQGGNPQVSGLIWNKMVYAWYQALETKAAAVLTANAGSITDIALTTAATDDDLVNELEAALAGLQFVAGGDLLTIALTHIDLYERLAAAVDSTGRKLLPIYGATNANGGARSRFKSLDVAGYEFAPARALGSAGSVSANSWLCDPQAVHVWNSAPQRLDFQYRVAYVDLAIWGYVASAVTDTSGVRQITYDPTA